MKLQRDTCPICLEAFDSTESKVQPCNHSFCRSCIYTWAALRATCPLCSKPFVTISILSEEEDKKEEIIKIAGTSATYIQQEEDFECLDHGHFLKEFQALHKKTKEAEFELKAKLVIKKGLGESERDYQLILHVKQEIELKLAFLAQGKKIFPKELLEEVEHFSSVIKGLWYGNRVPKEIEKSYSSGIYADEEYYNEDGEEKHRETYK